MPDVWPKVRLYKSTNISSWDPITEGDGSGCPDTNLWKSTLFIEYFICFLIAKKNTENKCHMTHDIWNVTHDMGQLIFKIFYFGAMIRPRCKIQCLPYAGFILYVWFFSSFYLFLFWFFLGQYVWDCLKLWIIVFFTCFTDDTYFFSQMFLIWSKWLHLHIPNISLKAGHICGLALKKI